MDCAVGKDSKGSGCKLADSHQVGEQVPNQVLLPPTDASLQASVPSPVPTNESLRNREAQTVFVGGCKNAVFVLQ